ARILPSRVAGYDENDLDSLLASGAVIWVGGGAIGPRDGKVALYLSEHAPLVPEATTHDGSTHQRIREALAARGALFFPQLLAARSQQLLERHGVITRELVQYEGAEGGFAAVYGVLRAMEEAGRVRRGYFVAGRGAAQFALPGAVDRLRDLREPGEEPAVITL